MSNYRLIIPLAVRELTVTIFGQKIVVTEKLFKDPAPVQKARAKLFEGRSSIEAILARRQDPSAPPTTEAEENEAFQTLLTQFDIAIAGDERMQACESFVESIIATDLVDDAGVPMPLEVQALYDSDVPKELLTMILDACAKAPYVPKR